MNNLFLSLMIYSGMPWPANIFFKNNFINFLLSWLFCIKQILRILSIRRLSCKSCLNILRSLGFIIPVTQWRNLMRVFEEKKFTGVKIDIIFLCVNGRIFLSRKLNKFWHIFFTSILIFFHVVVFVSFSMFWKKIDVQLILCHGRFW